MITSRKRRSRRSSTFPRDLYQRAAYRRLSPHFHSSPPLAALLTFGQLHKIQWSRSMSCGWPLILATRRRLFCPLGQQLHPARSRGYTTGHCGRLRLGFRALIATALSTRSSSYQRGPTRMAGWLPPLRTMSTCFRRLIETSTRATPALSRRHSYPQHPPAIHTAASSLRQMHYSQRCRPRQHQRLHAHPRQL